MPVPSALVTQYYTGILRQTPTSATVTQLANSADLSVLTSTLLSIANTSVDPILRLYQAAFGRVPDTTGLTNMVNVYAGNAQGTGTLTLTQMASQFTGSNEFVNLYGANTTNNASNTQFVGALYVNVLNRTMVGNEGAGWINLLNSGMSRNQILIGFSESPEFQAATNNAVDTFLTSAGALTNTYTGNLFFYGTAPDANIQTLRFGTDILTGRAGYDIFEAGLVNNGAGALVNSLDSSDRIAGGEGVNTINITLTGSPTVAPFALTNIQNINLSNAGVTTLDLSNANAVSNLNVINTVGNQTISGIQSASTNFLISNTSQDVTFNVAASLAGSADNANLTVKGVATGAAIAFTAGYETLTVNSVNFSASNTSNAIETDYAGTIILQDLGQASGGAVTNTLAGAAGGTAAITSTNVVATNLSGTLTTALAGTASTFQGGNGNTTVTGGAGSDRVTFGNGNDTFIVASLANLSAETAIVGGNGTDTITFSGLVFNSTSDASFNAVSGFETLQLGNIETNTIGLSSRFMSGGTVNGGTGADTIQVYANTAASATINGGLGTDVLALTNTGGGTFSILNVEQVTSTNASSIADTITIGTSGSSVGIDLGAGADTVIFGAGTTTALTITGVETVIANVTQTNNSVILANDSTVVTVNAASATAALTVNANAQLTAGNSFVFGAGNDNLIIASLAGLSNNASVIGAGGTSDTITLSALVNNTTADGNFRSVSTFETLQLGNIETNSIGLSSTFFGTAGFNRVVGGTGADTISVYGTTVASATINGGLGTDVLALTNTGGGTFSILNVEQVTSTNASSIADTITIGTSGSSVGIDLGAGADTVIFGAGTTTALTITGVETVIANVTQTNNSVILANDSTVVTVNAASATAALTVNANAQLTAGNSFVFGAGNDNLIIASLAGLSNNASVIGAGGTSDTITLSALVNNTTADGNFRSVSTFETLQLGNIETNSIGLSSTFFGTAGFNRVVGGTGADTISVYGTTVASATIDGGADSDTLALTNTAGGTFTILNVEAVTSTNAGNINDTIFVGASALTSGVTIALGGGTDSVTNQNTSSVTYTLQQVETYTGNVGADLITLSGATAATTIIGGGGADVITIGSNRATTSVTQQGLSGTMGVIGDVRTNGETVAIIGSGTYALTSIETVNVTEGAVVSLAATLNLGSADLTFAYDLASATTATFSLVAGNATTAYAHALTVSATDTGNSSITLSSGTNTGNVTNALVQVGGGFDLITLTATSTGAINQTISANLANEAAGYLITDSFQASNFNIALSTGSDTVNLYGATLRNAAGAQIALSQNTVAATTGFSNTNGFVLGTTFVTGTSTTLANLASINNNNGVIFQLLDTLVTGDFLTQAGINTAATYIASTIGASGTVANQKSVIIVGENTGGTAEQALFLFTENGTASGISVGELQLIGVVNSTTLSVSNFS